MHGRQSRTAQWLGISESEIYTGKREKGVGKEIRKRKNGAKKKKKEFEKTI